MSVEVRTPPGNTPPQDLDAETAILGAVMVSSDAMERVADILKPESFYQARNGHVFRAAVELFKRNEPVDSITVRGQLEKHGVLDTAGGAEYLASLEASAGIPANVESHARRVEETAVRRGLLLAATRIQELGLNNTLEVDAALDAAEKEIFRLATDRTTDDAVPLSTSLGEFWDQIEKLHEDPNSSIGVKSGFYQLDEMTGGFQPSSLCLLAARPGSGKTSWALNVAQHVAIKEKVPVAVFSLEMSRYDLTSRLLCAEANVNSRLIRTGKLSETDWQKIANAMGTLSEGQIFIDDRPTLTPLELRARARRLQLRHKIGLVVVDYIQLMYGSTRAENRNQEVSEISRSLKALARELDVPVLALSQLSRAPEQRGDHRPQLSDLRESGCLTGDSLVFLPESGSYRRMDELVGLSGFDVMAVNTETWRLEERRVTKAFARGRRPVSTMKTKLGRAIRATANHKFLTIDGWRRLDEIKGGDRIAAPRWLTGPTEQTMSDDQLLSMTTRVSNTNRDVIPAQVWQLYALPAKAAVGLTERQFQSQLGMAYCGSGLYRQNMSRDRAARVASVSGSEMLARLAESDVYWDRVESIEDAGFEDVYDLTVEGLHNFVVNDLIAHNSLEQDADLVMFIYREGMHNEDVNRNQAKLIVGKHRNGPIGEVPLLFLEDQTKFVNTTRQSPQGPQGPQD